MVYFHGRLTWAKGDSPIKIDSLCEKSSSLWKSLGRWGVISLGKGYYEFSFSSVEDLMSVRSVVSWNLRPGFLWLFTWIPDFNPQFKDHICSVLGQDIGASSRVLEAENNLCSCW